MVHFPVVSIPVLAIAVIAISFRPAFRAKYGLAVVAWSFVTAVATYLAAESGQALKAAFQLGETEIGDHESLGKMTSLLTIGLFIFVAALVLMSRRLGGGAPDSATSNEVSVPLLGLGLVASLLAILASIWVIRTGHAGATATWEGQLPVEQTVDVTGQQDDIDQQDDVDQQNGVEVPEPEPVAAADGAPAPAAEIAQPDPTATLPAPTPTPVAEQPEPVDPVPVEAEAEEPPAVDEAQPEPEVDTAEQAAGVFSPVDSTDPSVLAVGERRYVDSCVRCHAADGTGGRGPSLLGLAANEPDRQPHIDIIIEGGRGMPAFREALSDSEIEAVVSYIRSEFVLP